MHNKLYRFVFIGVITVLIDFFFYKTLSLITSVQIAKGISFMIGALFSYHANRLITFRFPINSFTIFIKFSSVYFFNMIINIISNSFLIDLIANRTEYSNIFAFFIATGLSATLNFLGMKYFIYR